MAEIPPGEAALPAASKITIDDESDDTESDATPAEIKAKIERDVDELFKTKTVEEMEAMSYDAALQSVHRAGVQGSIAIAYTVWAKKKGGGRAIVNEVYKMVKKSNHLNRLVTLSPLTEMARNFHIKNGAKELQVNETTQNFEYDITLEEWETALVKAKGFLKVK